jgi:hypothetical protein
MQIRCNHADAYEKENGGVVGGSIEKVTDKSFPVQYSVQ